LLDLRRRELMPRLAAIHAGTGRFSMCKACLLEASWALGDGARYFLIANLGEAVAQIAPRPVGRTLYGSPGADDALGRLPAWSVLWRFEKGDG
jgi:hypothetical protein